MSTPGSSRWPAASLLVAALAMSGCASMNRSECAAVDWQTIGYEDGAAGRAGERMAEHRKACAKYGVTPDLGLYQAGRRQGLREYCRPQNGYSVGADGGRYNGICPVEMEAAFVDAFESGRQLFTLRSRVWTTASHLDSAHQELDHVEHEIVAKSVVVVSSTASTEDRTQSLLSTQQLAEKAGRLKAEIAQLERDRARYQRDLEDYLASNPRSS